LRTGKIRVADADEKRGPLSDWLELMLAEITRRREEALAGDIEQAARASQPSQPAASQARTSRRARSA
jgi:hypothetical protein